MFLRASSSFVLGNPQCVYPMSFIPEERVISGQRGGTVIVLEGSFPFLVSLLSLQVRRL